MTISSTVPPPGRELLDDLQAPAGMVRASLDNIAVANRWLGGVATARFGLDRLLAGSRPRRLDLLDVGTGAGDIPKRLGAWLARRGTRLAAFGVERHPAAARHALGSGLPTTMADGLRLPLRDGAVDVVLLSQIAHHLDHRRVVILAREASRVARIGVVLADLRPSRLATWGFKAASRVLSFDRSTRLDGVVSIRRGFAATELRALLADAGVDARVATRARARIVAYWSTR